jgi:uncharacterized protein YlxP (DUF503 family)
MIVGLLKVELYIPDSHSLKERRMVLNSLKANLHNHFNVSVAQIDGEDKWQKACLAVAGVAKDRRSMDCTLAKTVDFIAQFPRATIINYETELI